MQISKQELIHRLSEDGLLLEYYKSFNNDLDVASAAVTQNNQALRHVGTKLLNNRDFIIPLVHQDGSLLLYVGDELREDFETVLTAVSQNGRAIWFSGPIIKHNDTIIEAALNQTSEAIEWLNIKECSTNIHAQIIKHLEVKGSLIKKIKLEEQTLEMMLAACYGSGTAILDIPPHMTFDPRILFVHRYGRDIKSDDWTIVKKALLTNPDMFLDPPPAVKSITEGIKNEHLYRAQYALMNIDSPSKNICEIEFV